MEDLSETFQKCWKMLIDRYKLRKTDFAFLSESDIHRHLANLLEKEKAGQVHLEFPMPLDSSKFWSQIQKFRKVTFHRGYYRADICVLVERTPRLISEIRWMPALFPPFQFLKRQDEKVKIAQEKLEKKRRRYQKGIPRWYISKVFRNLEKFFEVLHRYRQDSEIDGFLCVIDELCPNIDQQLEKEISRFKAPDNFHLLVGYIK